jgi:hypothetical protein
MAGFSPDQRLTMTSLQGLVNRDGPCIYLKPGGYDFWVSKLGYPTNRYPRAWDLIGKYRASFNGLVVYDAKVPSTINIATTLAGLNNLWAPPTA